MDTISTISGSNILDMSSFIKDIATLNLEYLAICVTIIIFLGTAAISLFWIFSVKPLEKKLRNQEIELKKLKEETVEKIEDLSIRNEKKLEETAGRIELSYDLKTKNLYKSLERIQSKFESENARSLAIVSDNLGVSHACFYWWLKAAYYRNLLNSKGSGVKIAIDFAKKALEKTKWDLLAHDFLDNKVNSIRYYFDGLKPSNEVKIRLMEELFDKIFNTEKKEVTIPLLLGKK